MVSGKRSAFTVAQKLEMIQMVARAEYLNTGDKWWRDLSLMVGEKREKYQET